MTTWRCDKTGNPVGTDAVMLGAPLCKCQGCRASHETVMMRAQMKELFDAVCACRKEIPRVSLVLITEVARSRLNMALAAVMRTVQLGQEREGM